MRSVVDSCSGLRIVNASVWGGLTVSGETLRIRAGDVTAESPSIELAAAIAEPGSGIDEEVKSAMEGIFAQLRSALGKTRATVDVMSGFEVLDAAVGSRGSALEQFALRWKAFRGSSQVEVDPMATAILAGNVPGLGDLIAGADAAKIRIDRNELPLELPRRPNGPATLLDVAASIGGAPLRYVLEFFGLKPAIETLHQAVATGEFDLIRTIWDRLSPSVRVTHVAELAITAADYHHPDAATGC
jgi:hypothetical protein